MSIIVSPLVDIYRSALSPIAPFSYFGLPISTLDLLGAARLCLILRQIREINLAEHVRKPGAVVEPKSFVRDLTTTLTVVYGGEVIASPLLSTPPSFMISPVGTILFAAVQFAIDSIPTSSLPLLSLNSELPFSFVDGLTRAFLLCSVITPMVTTNALPNIAASPWTLLLTALFTANGGFFLTNAFSLLSPGPMTFTTPPELGPYGWTTTDLWCAPLITSLYALLTHAQPFWTSAHVVLSELLGGALGSVSYVENADAKAVSKTIQAVDPEVARAVCAAILVVMFSVRTVKNFGGQAGLEGPKTEKNHKEKQG